MIDLSGRVVFVSGSASGIGCATATLFAKSGANLVIHGLDQAEELLAVKDDLTQLGSKVLVSEGDLTDEDVVAQVVDQVRQEFGCLDVLVNCVGASPMKNFLKDMPLDNWNRILAINLNTQMLMCRGFLPLLERGKSKSIINISSSVSRVGGVPVSLPI